MVTLWSISRSPLFLGANLTRLDTSTTALVTNAEVIGVNQHSVENHQVEQDGDVVVVDGEASTGHRDASIWLCSISGSRRRRWSYICEVWVGREI